MKKKKKKQQDDSEERYTPVFEKNEQVLSSMIHCRLHLFFYQLEKGLQDINRKKFDRQCMFDHVKVWILTRHDSYRLLNPIVEFNCFLRLHVNQRKKKKRESNSGKFLLECVLQHVSIILNLNIIRIK